MDLNSDGTPDLISGSYIPGDVYLFAGVKGGGFKKGVVLSEAKSAGVEKAASAASFSDWNGDGLLDMLVGNIAGEVFVALNTGSKTEPKFGAREKIKVQGGDIDGHSDAHPLMVDWDADGALDLLVGTGDGKVLFFRGNGAKPPVLEKGEYVKDSRGDLKLGNRLKIFPYDWNNDGKLDLLAGNFDMDQGGGDLVGNVYVVMRK